MTARTTRTKLPDIPEQSERKTPAISRKVQDAIRAMVWEGLKRADAAQKAGMTDHGLYVAMRSPHVKAAYLAECEVLRVSGRARRIHRLEEMVEQNDNKAAVVNAALALERLNPDDISSTSSGHSTPGVTIKIVQLVAPTDTQLTQRQVVTIDNDDGSSG